MSYSIKGALDKIEQRIRADMLQHALLHLIIAKGLEDLSARRPPHVFSKSPLASLG